MDVEFGKLWSNTNESYCSVSAATKPAVITNDFIIELLRRTMDPISAQFASSYWKRQIAVKGRKHDSNNANSPSPIFMGPTIEDRENQREDLIDPFISRLQTEDLPASSFSSTVDITLLLQTDINRKNPSGFAQLSKFWDGFFSAGGLRLLICFLVGPYKNSYWEPLIDLLLKILLWNHDEQKALPNLPSLHISLATTDHRGKTALEILFEQIYKIKTLSKPVQGSFCKLWNILSRLQDVSWIQRILQKYLCEVLLKPLITKDKRNTAELEMPSALRDLITAYKTPQRVFTTNSETKENLVMKTIITPLYASTQGKSIADCDVISFFFPVIDLLVTLTSQSVTGRYIAWLLCFWIPPTKKENTPFYLIQLLFKNLVLFKNYQRRMGATLLTLQSNCLEYLKIKDNNETRSIIRAPFNQENFFKLLGTDIALPTNDFLLDIVHHNLYLPQMSLRFLCINDYLRRNFVLAKLNLSTQIWQTFVRSQDDDLRELSRFSVHSSTCYRHNDQSQIFFEVPDVSCLVYSRSKSKNESPCHFMFLLECNRDTKEIFHMIPIEYCTHYPSKNGKERSIVVCCHMERSLWLTVQSMNFTHYIVTNPALRASLESHSAIHSLLIESTRSNVFPVWFERILTGKDSPAKLSHSATQFSESQSFLDSLQREFQFKGVITPSQVELYFRSRRPILDNTKASRRTLHSPSVICPSCVLRLEEVMEEETELLSTPHESGNKWEEIEDTTTFHYRIILECDYILSSSKHTSPRSERNIRGVKLDFNRASSETCFDLYPAQQQAILSSLFSRISLIIGPPGTGKTSVTTQIIRLFYENFYLGTPKQETPKKILLVAQSNNAVDQLVERLHEFRVPVLRIGSQSSSDIAKEKTFSGYLESMPKTVLEIFTELKGFVCQASDIASVLDQLRESMQCCEPHYGDIYQTLRGFMRENFLQETVDFLMRWDSSQNQSDKMNAIEIFCTRTGVRWFHEKVAEHMKDIITRFRKNLRQAELYLQILSMESSLDQKRAMFKSVAVVAATCSGVSMNRHIIRPCEFDSVVIEEAGKVLEAECLFAFSNHLKRLVLVGDDQQMRSVVHDVRLKVNSELDQSLLTRLQRLGISTIQLNQQTRARPSIANLYRWRYHNLTDHLSTEEIEEIATLPSNVLYEDVKVKKGSLAETSPAEYIRIMKFVHYLNSIGINKSRITILTPYKKQKHFIQSRLQNDSMILVCTVDEYQGKENDIILVSLAFSGPRASPFLCDERRINVLTSRAKRLFVLFGNIDSISKIPPWERVLSSMKELKVKL